MQRWIRTAGSLSTAFGMTLAAALAALAGTAGRAEAQGVTTGAITGFVRDSIGQPVGGANVLVVYQPTGFRSTAVTNDKGLYNIQGLEPGGPYRVSVTAIGYRPSAREGVSVRLSQSTKVDATLQRQAVELQELVVQAEGGGEEFNYSRQGTQTTINQKDLESLPTIDRDFSDFIKLTPQVSVREGEGGITAVGQNNRFNTIQVDGATVNDRFGLGRTGQAGGQADGRAVGLEAVKEYQVLLSPYDVRQGNFTGALINAVTKSGTNTFSGSAFVYRRSDGLAGYPVSQNEFSNWQYGFSLGGPIVRDQLHFFTNFERRDETQPAAGPFFGGTVDPMVARQADVDAFNARAQALGLSGGNLDLVENQRPLDNFLGRLDYQLGSSSRLVAKFQYNNASRDVFSRTTSLSNPTLDLNSYGYFFQNDTYNPSLQLRTQLSNGMSNELMASVNIIRDRRTPNVLEPIVLVQNYGQAGGTGTYSLRSGSEEFSQGNELDQDIWEFTDNFTMPVGVHNLTFGARLELYKARNLFAQQTYGIFQYDDQADFDAGVVEQYNVRVALPGSNGGEATFRGGQFALYAQDDWAVSETFTLNPGLRVEIPYFSTELAYDPRVIADFGPQDKPGGQVMLSPRLGFNWDVRGEGTSQLRGGLGVFTGAPAFVWYSNAYANNGLGLVGLQCGGSGSTHAAPAFNVDNVANPVTACADGFTVGSGGSLGEVDLIGQDTKFPQVFRANLAYDQRLPYGIVGTLEGLYSKDINQFFIVNRNLNPSARTDARTGRVMYGDVQADGRVTTSYFNSATYGLGSGGVYELRNTDAGYSWSLAGSLRKSFGQSLQASASYVYSEAYDVQSFTSSRAISNWRFGRVTAIADDAAERTVSSFSRPHRLVANVSYTLRWSLPTDISFTYIGQSGSPYTLTSTGSSGRGDLNADGNVGNDPLYLPTGVGDANGYVFASADQEQAFNEYIDGEACLREQRGRIMERNSCRNPWQNSLDVAVRQNLPVLNGRASLELQIFNFLRMLDRDWGQVKSAAPDEFYAAPVLTVTGATGVNGQEVVTFNPTLLDQRFRPVSSAASINRSAYYIQLGAKYTF